eukprot:TRINITY_DN351_c0_g1_i2.p1 TRINITY_DN351_c0_g1~~TRINITY_DN351_c0_g1_i2.p1  ORF type:complete len:342 (-),score=165.78 TRINITY_DN351_c0_g1_i2:132-1157(-)
MEELIEVTGASHQEAQYFLNAANSNLELAIELYMSSKSTSTSTPTSTPTSTSKPTSKATATGRDAQIRGFSDLNKKEEGDPKMNEYYAGGSKSGVQIQAPKNEDVINSTFEKAKSLGAQNFDESTKPQQETFVGRGYFLGSDGTGPSRSVVNQSKKPQRVKICFYKNCIVIDDGPTMPYNTPETNRFIEQINSGVIPSSLVQQYGNAEIDAEMIDKKTEDYVPPKPKVQPFSGQGLSLSSSSSSNAPSAAATQITNTTFALDQSKPSTSIQIRLHDGTKLTVKLNHTHTIQDIRNFVARAQLLKGRNFELSTSFPRKILTDNQQTIAEAGLLNSVILQTLV